MLKKLVEQNMKNNDSKTNILLLKKETINENQSKKLKSSRTLLNFDLKDKENSNSDDFLYYKYLAQYEKDIRSIKKGNYDVKLIHIIQDLLINPVDYTEIVKYSFLKIFISCLQQIKRTDEDVNMISCLFTILPNFLSKINIPGREVNSFLIYLSKRLEYQYLEKDKILFRTADPADKIYIVLSGKVDVILAKLRTIKLNEIEYFRYLIRLFGNKEVNILYKVIDLNKQIFPDYTKSNIEYSACIYFALLEKKKNESLIKEIENAKNRIEHEEKKKKTLNFLKKGIGKVINMNLTEKNEEGKTENNQITNNQEFNINEDNKVLKNSYKSKFLNLVKKSSFININVTDNLNKDSANINIEEDINSDYNEYLDLKPSKVNNIMSEMNFMSLSNFNFSNNTDNSSLTNTNTNNKRISYMNLENSNFDLNEPKQNVPNYSSNFNKRKSSKNLKFTKMFSGKIKQLINNKDSLETKLKNNEEMGIPDLNNNINLNIDVPVNENKTEIAIKNINNQESDRNNNSSENNTFLFLKNLNAKNAKIENNFIDLKEDKIGNLKKFNKNIASIIENDEQNSSNDLSSVKDKDTIIVQNHKEETIEDKIISIENEIIEKYNKFNIDDFEKLISTEEYVLFLQNLKDDLVKRESLENERQRENSIINRRKNVTFNNNDTLKSSLGSLKLRTELFSNKTSSKEYCFNNNDILNNFEQNLGMNLSENPTIYYYQCKKEVSTFNFVYIRTMSEGDIFGVLGLESKDQRRSASIVTKSNCHFATLDTENYRKGLKAIIDREVKNDMHFLNSLFLFTMISMNSFKSQFYNLFVYHNYNKGMKIFEKDEESNSIIIINQGEFELSYNGTSLDIFSLILKYLNCIISELEFLSKFNKEKNYIGKTDEFYDLIKYYNSLEESVKSQMLEYKWNIETKRLSDYKRKFNLIIFQNEEILGLKNINSVNIDGKNKCIYNLTCCSDKGKIFMINERDFRHTITNKTCIKLNLLDYKISKFCLVKYQMFLNRFIGIKDSIITETNLRYKLKIGIKENNIYNPIMTKAAFEKLELKKNSKSYKLSINKLELSKFYENNFQSNINDEYKDEYEDENKNKNEINSCNTISNTPITNVKNKKNEVNKNSIVFINIEDKESLEKRKNTISSNFNDHLSKYDSYFDFKKLISNDFSNENTSINELDVKRKRTTDRKLSVIDLKKKVSSLNSFKSLKSFGNIVTKKKSGIVGIGLDFNDKLDNSSLLRINNDLVYNQASISNNMNDNLNREKSNNSSIRNSSIDDHEKEKNCNIINSKVTISKEENLDFSITTNEESVKNRNKKESDRVSFKKLDLNYFTIFSDNNESSDEEKLKKNRMVKTGKNNIISKKSKRLYSPNEKNNSLKLKAMLNKFYDYSSTGTSISNKLIEDVNIIKDQLLNIDFMNLKDMKSYLLKVKSDPISRFMTENFNINKHDSLNSKFTINTKVKCESSKSMDFNSKKEKINLLQNNEYYKGKIPPKSSKSIMKRTDEANYRYKSLNLQILDMKYDPISGFNEFNNYKFAKKINKTISNNPLSPIISNNIIHSETQTMNNNFKDIKSGFMHSDNDKNQKHTNIKNNLSISKYLNSKNEMQSNIKKERNFITINENKNEVENEFKRTKFNLTGLNLYESHKKYFMKENKNKNVKYN